MSGDAGPSLGVPGADATIARLLHVYRSGSTSPVLAETQTGARYVTKLAGAGPGLPALATELLATRIAERLGLAVPRVRPLYLPTGFPWQIGTDEFDDLIGRSAGWNLGSAYVEQGRDLTAADLAALPPAFLSRLALADRLLQNVDRGASNPNLLIDPSPRIWAIDHGACLFLDRVVRDRRPFRFALPAGHFLSRADAPLPSDRGERVARIDGPFLHALLAAIPPNWLAGFAITPGELARRLSAYVAAFAAEIADTA